MRNLVLTLIILTFLGNETIAQKTVQWASRLVRYSSQMEDEFYAAKQVLGPPNAMTGYSDSPYSWSPKDPNGNREEYIHVEFGIPMRVSQFAIVESLNPGAVSKVVLVDTKGKSHKVYERTSFKPSYSMSRFFTKKITFTDYKVVGMKVYLKTSAIKGYNQIDAIAISNNNETIKSKINTLTYSDRVEKAENLGLSVNSKYSERLPIISPDGNTLYFTRKYHPENMGEQNKDDIWVAKRSGYDEWTRVRNSGAPLNNDLHNFVIAVSPDNNQIYVASAYKKGEKDGVAIARRRGNAWGKPQTLQIENMYNKSRFAGYHVSMNGNILLMAIERDDTEGDRDLYVSFKKSNNQWSQPKNLGAIVNSVGMESSVFLAADNRTIYFSSNGFAGYGGLDMYMSRRLDDSWENWTTPKNLGRDINTPGNDYNYTIPASGDYAYFSSDYMSNGQSDLFRIRLPKEARPDPVMLIENDIVENEEEELDGDIVVNDPIIQKEVDDLKERLRRLNEELSEIEDRKSPPVADTNTPDIPEDRPASYEDEPSRKSTASRKSAPNDPELERLKNKYNRHLNKDYEDETDNNTNRNTDVATNNDRVNEPNRPEPAKRRSTSTASNSDDENEALRRKLMILRGEIPADEEEEVVHRNNDKPSYKPTPDTPETPDVPERPEKSEPTTAEVDVEAIKEEIRQALKEELRDDVKSELKRDMIDDVREDLEDEMRIDLEDDLKEKVEEDLKSKMEGDVRRSLEDDVKRDLKEKLKSDVEDDLRDELADEVRAEVEKELRDELAAEVERELRNEMEYRIKKEMETQIRRELEAKIRAQLEDEYAEKLKNTPEKPIEKEEEVVIVPLKVGEIIPMNNIFFDANETTLKDASYTELEKVLNFLKQHPNLIVEIGGHTNSWCSHEFANQLSSGRAKEVRTYLIDQGISKTRIQSHGYGKTQPIADNKTVQGRKKNQRVEMKIVEIID